MTRIPLIALMLSVAFSGCGDSENSQETTVKASPVPYADLDWLDDLFLLEEKPFTGTAISFHKDGTTKKSEFVFRAGKFHGTVREWWENGTRNTETEFADGLRHGKNTYWDKDGQLIKEQVYENGTVTFEKIHQ